jgi:Lon protease-like protein
MAFELPLFPLNTLLFPEMPISLHIFEERYKLMIQRCLENDEPFGVVLIRQGREAGGDAAPFEVGCMARINHVDRLEGGRMNLVAIGEERFKIEAVYRDKPYLTGMVNEFPLLDDIGSDLCTRGRYLNELMAKYLDLLRRVSEVNLRGKMPANSLSLAYLGATLLQMPADKKQPLLTHTTSSDLVKAVMDMYRFEIPVLNTMVTPRPKFAKEPEPFSLN